ncbi:putative retrotransposon protein, partial [Tanacetum coccineum]
ETIGYSFYYLPKNKIFVARNAEFLENSLINHEASRSLEDLEIIQEEDTHPSLDTSLNHKEDDQEIDEPQRDLGEPANYKAALLDPESDKWLNAINVEIQSMKDNKVWELVDLPPNGKTIGHKFGKWMSKLLSSLDISMKRYTWSNLKVLSARNFKTDQNCDEPCVYVKASGSYVTFLILYVDDILIMGNNILMLQDVKSYLGRCFAMKDLGEAAYILGIKIYRDRSKRLIGLCQSAYIEKILKRYYMENSKRGTIPMQEKLKFSKSQGASTPAEIQRMQNIPYASVKRELRVSCYTDAGYLTDADDMKSQTRYVFILNGGAVDWKSTKQSNFATSSTYAKYIAAFDASKEAVWIHKFNFRPGVVPTIEESINMYCDNTGAIAIAKDL